MAMYKFVLPDVGNHKNIPVIEILVNEGDTIEKDQSILTLESDKATMEIPAPVAGVVRNIQVKLEQKINQGDWICDIETTADAVAPAAKTEAPAPAPAPITASQAEMQPLAPKAEGMSASVQKFTLPDIGNHNNIPVIEILVNEGDRVERDQSLLTLESDKATMEIPAPFAGVVRNIQVKLEQKINQGDWICDIETTAGAAPAAKAETSAPAPMSAAVAPMIPATVPAASTPPASAGSEKPINAPSSGAKYHASPSVRAYARNLGVELQHVVGSGPKNRIQTSDVEAYIKAVMQGEKPSPRAPAANVTGSGIPPVPLIDFTPFGATEQVELSRIKKLSGKHLAACWLNIPHVTQFDEADITELEDFRASLKARAEKAGVKMTPLPFVMKAVVQALKEFPHFNASLSLDGGSLILKKYFNLGVAVDTPNGLVVPVVRDVDQKGLFELARELGEISQRARDGKLSPTDMSGGCFSISSLGGIGGTQFTPIVNAPEVAILGLSKAKMAPVWNGTSFEPRLMLPFSVSYDHRVIDGAQGVRFTTRLAQLLRDLREMLI